MADEITVLDVEALPRQDDLLALLERFEKLKVERNKWRENEEKASFERRRLNLLLNETRDRINTVLDDWGRQQQEAIEVFVNGNTTTNPTVENF